MVSIFSSNIWFDFAGLFFFHVKIPLVISEVIEQKCPEVKPNQVKNKPEVDTYFQNSIREAVKISYL